MGAYVKPMPSIRSIHKKTIMIIFTAHFVFCYMKFCKFTMERKCCEQDLAFITEHKINFMAL